MKLLNFTLKNKNFKVFSPVSGLVLKLEDLDDIVFKNKMLGDGIAIIPDTGIFVAPFSGDIVHVAKTWHAIVIKSTDGNSILIHMGIDTVHLGRDVFECVVNEGQQVKNGEMLARMDIDNVIKSGKKIISPIILIEDDKSTVKQKCSDKVMVGDLLFTVN